MRRRKDSPATASGRNLGAGRGATSELRPQGASRGLGEAAARLAVDRGAAALLRAGQRRAAAREETGEVYGWGSRQRLWLDLARVGKASRREGVLGAGQRVLARARGGAG